MSDFAEKRKYPRIYFPKEQEMRAKIFDRTGTERFFVKILNISEGGVQLTCKRMDHISLKGHPPLLLSGISGLDALNSITNLSMEVRWVMDNDYFDHILLGCEFIEISAENRKILRKFTLHGDTEKYDK